MTERITVCIATIPPRQKLLRKALSSVCIQTLAPTAIIVESDPDRTGAAATKNRALAKASTEWVAFLDDDDQFMPEHLDKLFTAAQREDADVVYSRPFIPQIPDHEDPTGRRGAPFDADELRERSYIQTTSLIRADLMRKAGGFQVPPPSKHYIPQVENYDDWGAWLAMLDLGARFFHVNEQTFIWNHWGAGVPGQPGNTSGRPDRW
jgi:glycosyltransferase involved in cell wall biosynthesis